MLLGLRIHDLLMKPEWDEQQFGIGEDMRSTLHVTSCGMGTQSSTYLLMCEVEGFRPIDYAVFADTGDEPCHGGSVGGGVYGWADWLEGQITKFPIYRVRKLISLGDSLIQMAKAKQDQSYAYVKGSGPTIPFFGEDEFGNDIKLKQTCTADWKASVLDSFNKNKMKELGADKVIVYKGITTDEAHRMKPAPEKERSWLEFKYPFVENGISRDDCLAWMDKHKFPRPPKSACVFCPHINPKRLSQVHPKDLAKAAEIERIINKGLKGADGTNFYITKFKKPITEVAAMFNAQGDIFDDFGEDCGGQRS